MEICMPANMYRAEKMPIYSATEGFPLGAGQRLGAFGPSKALKGKINTSVGTPILEKVGLQFAEEVDRFDVGGHYNEGDYVVYVLTDEQGNNIQFQLKTVKPAFTAMCVGNFQNEDLTYFQRFINKDASSGTYKLWMFIEAKFYTSDVEFIV